MLQSYKTKIVLVGLALIMPALIFSQEKAHVKVDEKPWLGVYLSDYEKSVGDVTHYGAIIEEVVEDSPAEEAGLKEEDVIIKMQNKTVRNAEDVTNDLPTYKPGDEVELVVVRDEKNLTVKVKLSGKELHRIVESPRRKEIIVKIGSPYLGIQMQNLNDDLSEYFQVKADEGVLVVKVEKDSPADKAGLKSGDVITEFDGKKITETDELAKAVRKADKDAKVTVGYVRKGRPAKVEVKLDEGKKLRKYHIGEEGMEWDFLPFDDHVLRLELDELRENTEDLQELAEEHAEQLKRELPKHLELDVKVHGKAHMEELQEEMQQLKEELKELKEELKKELKK